MTVKSRARLLVTLVATSAFVAVAACGDDDPVSPGGDGTAVLAFSPSVVDLADARATTVAIRNTGPVSVGPVELITSPVVNSAGLNVPESSVHTSESEISTLAPGASRDINLTVSLPNGLAEGSYRTRLDARAENRVMASLSVDLRVEVVSPILPMGSIEITAGPSTLRRGEVGAYQVEARDSVGAITGIPVMWTVDPASSGIATESGRFVGYETGPVRLIAGVPGLADTMIVQVTARGIPSGGFADVGAGPVSDRFSSDHWEYGNAAYTGTWGCRVECGNTLYVWDITNRSSPSLSDSIRVDARTVNDVKVRADGTLAIITHEGSEDGLNGITLLDLADPLHPTVTTRFTSPELSPGVHNVWVEGDYAYLVVDETSASSGLRILDISNPSSPTIVGHFYAGSSFLHDVYVRDGLAFLSHWSAGLVILDVGNGIRGGSPTNPMEVSRFAMPLYNVHNAWYWPDAGYVFLGDEIGVPGRMEVVDVRNPEIPVYAATLTIDGAAPHNFWLDEIRGIAYLAWYEQGLQAVDVSGELMGQLELQGRRIAELQYGQGNACIDAQGTCTWAPQLHDGLVYVSDLNTGLRVLEPQF